jgi:TetR/AcrR family transcriptional repressor of the ameABC operon
MKIARPTREKTHARIMDQADVLFQQFGYSKTTVADIAGELGMSTANIYKFFPSKNAIIQAGADRRLNEIKEILTRVVRAKRSAGSRLLGVVLSIYEFHREYFRHERQIYKLVLAATEENWSCVRVFKEFLTQVLEDVISEGVRNGELRRVNVPETTRALIDCFTWITNPLLFREIDPKEVAERARTQIHLIEQALQAPATPRFSSRHRAQLS